MGTRTLHNFKRRLKLIEKHTGKPYSRQVSKGKGKGKGKAKGRADAKDGKGGKGSNDGKGGKLSKAGKHGKSTKQVDDEGGRPRRLGNFNELVESCTRLLDRDTASAIGAVSSSKESAKAKPKASGKVKRVKKLLKTKAKAASKSALSTKRRKVKVQSEGEKKSLVSGKLKKRKQLPSEREVPVTEKKISRKALRREKLRERKRVRHRAYIICPGSVTERSARGPLNGNEARLLATGALSWRWLREEDPDCMPPSPWPESEPKLHSWELEARLGRVSQSVGAKLKYLDKCLETDALWPPCVARIDLAARLQTKKGLQRRCERYLAEVVAPLLEEPEALPACSAGPGNVESSGAPLLVEARRVMVRCVQEWQQTDTSGSTDSLRVVWLHMLRRSLAVPEDSTAAGLLAWQRALRCAILARVCPRPDAETQQQMLRTVTGAAATAAASLASAGGVTKSQEAGLVVVIPLGLFTCWQALLLVAATRSLGGTATVVRRSAGGTPQMLFRSADIPADDPAAWPAAE